MLRCLGYRGDLQTKCNGSYHILIEQAVQRARMALIFRDLRSSTPRMSNPHHLHSTQTGDPCPSAVPFSCSGLASRRHPSRTPSCPSIIGGLITQDVRQRLDSRVAVEHCEKVTLYLVCFHHIRSVLHDAVWLSVCMRVHTSLRVRPPRGACRAWAYTTSGIETETASVDTDNGLTKMLFLVYAEQLFMRLLCSDGSLASASGKHRCWGLCSTPSFFLVYKEHH